MASTTTDSVTQRGGAVRDPHLDNVKAVLIGLVVVGHTVGQVIVSYPPAGALYAWIYQFHMPAFVFLCGLLTATGPMDSGRARSLLRAMLVPYLVFQVAFVAYHELFGRDVDWGVDRLLSPQYHLWFLVALLLWRVSAPLLAQIRHILVLAVGVSLVAGTSSALDHTLALNRVAGLLPFFVLGLLHGRRLIHRLPSGGMARVLAGFCLAGALPVAAAVHEHLGLGWLYWNGRYHALGVGALEGMAIRGALMVVALLMTLSLIVLVPRRRTFLTTIGERSMFPYLLHPFVTLAFAFSTLRATTAWEFAVVILLAVALAVALASWPVARVFGGVVAPRGVAVPTPPRRRCGRAASGEGGHPLKRLRPIDVGCPAPSAEPNGSARRTGLQAGRRHDRDQVSRHGQQRGWHQDDQQDPGAGEVPGDDVDDRGREHQQAELDRVVEPVERGEPGQPAQPGETPGPGSAGRVVVDHPVEPRVRPRHVHHVVERLVEDDHHGQHGAERGPAVALALGDVVEPAGRELPGPAGSGTR